MSSGREVSRRGPETPKNETKRCNECRNLQKKDEIQLCMQQQYASTTCAILFVRDLVLRGKLDNWLMWVGASPLSRATPVGDVACGLWLVACGWAVNVDVAQIVELILYFEETSVNTSSAGETTAAALGAKGSSLQYDDGSTCSANSMRRSCVSRSEDTGSTITGDSLFELWTCDRRRRRILEIFDSKAFSKREPQDQQRE